MEAYTDFATVYDTFMDETPYEVWGDFVVELINKYGISAGQLSRLRANNHISTHTIERLCEILDCNIEDIVHYSKDMSQ